MSQTASGHQPPASNGVLTAPTGRGSVGVNKKKQKRRAKLAARQAGEDEPPHSSNPPVNGQPPQGSYSPSAEHRHATQYSTPQYHSQETYDQDLDYTSDEDEEPIAYHSHDPRVINGGLYGDDLPAHPSKNKKKKKKRGQANQLDMPYGGDPAAMISSAVSRFALPNPPPLPRQPSAMRHNKAKQDRIWNTSTQEERERIKEFWLSLTEEERKGLLKIEKAAVLNKMKEQQKHSCSCTVCGRKRTAIEEELEVLYDAYYEELAQYANQPHQDPTDLLEATQQRLPYPTHQRIPPPQAYSDPQAPHHRSSRVHEIIDEGDQFYSEEDHDHEDYSDEAEYSDEDDYESDIAPAMSTGFFDFGNNLTVKDGILTVADDLLKNDGKKFIEMMEQLAERRMQREQEVEYASQQPSHSHEPPLDDEDEFDDEDDYDSQEDYDDEEEEDEMGGMTEEQRMEEGRRMFQIFAARMFEQRVLTAYREKVALERQSRLLEELEEEDKVKTQKDAKKAKDAEKKKSKKLAQKQAKAEEKAKKDAERAAEEAAAKAAEEKRLEEARRKREDQKRKKEMEKKAQEEEKSRKEAERLKRQQEERDRQAELERKARDQKAQEKRLRDDAKKREREEREAREKEAREQKAHDDKQRKDIESSQREAKEKKAAPQIVKRPSQPGPIAVPPALTSQKSSSGISSPHIPVATPAVPKTATPGGGARARQGSEARSLPQTQSQPGVQKNKSPITAETANHTPKTILQNPHKQQRPAISLPQPISHQGPHPGMHMPFPGGVPANLGFPPHTGPSGTAANRPGGFHFSQQQQGPPPPPGQFRPFQPAPGVSPSPSAFGSLPHDRQFAGDVPPGFQQQMPGLGQHQPTTGIATGRLPTAGHSRQNSTNELDMSPPPHAQPISRPAPIQRPSSVRPSGEFGDSSEIDDLAKHLGSRALLDDADDPVPPAAELRRTSNPIGAPRGTSMGFSSPLFTNAPGFGSNSNSWSSPSGFGPGHSGLSTPNWGTGLGAGASWTGGFGPLSSGRPPVANRPRSVRLAVCNACRAMSASVPGSTGNEYHHVSQVMSTIERMGTLDAPPSLREIEDICDTEGDSHNGGGLLHIRRSGPNFAVRFEQDAPASSVVGRPAGGLGEIGSPVPGNSLPAAFGQGGGGRSGGPFGGSGSSALGGLASSSSGL